MEQGGVDDGQAPEQRGDAQSNGIICTLAVMTCWHLSSLCWANMLVEG